MPEVLESVVEAQESPLSGSLQHLLGASPSVVFQGDAACSSLRERWLEHLVSVVLDVEGDDREALSFHEELQKHQALLEFESLGFELRQLLFREPMYL